MEEKKIKEFSFEIQKIFQQDIGNRGIKDTFEKFPNILFESAKCLYSSCLGMGIFSGFFIPSTNSSETDGPLGMFSIVNAFLRIKKSVPVYIIIDKNNEIIINETFKELIDEFKERLNFVVFQSKEEIEGKKGKDLLSKLDVLISIERVGRAKDNIFYNMRAVDISSFTLPLDSLFLQIKETKQEIKTIAIGDGLNETGMGIFYEIAKKNVRFGETIGCVVDSDYPITAGVSNWGGDGLAIVLIAFSCLNNSQLKVELSKIFPTFFLLSKILDNILEKGAVDGISHKSERSVDGLKFDKVHKEILDKSKEKFEEFFFTF
ncbi:d-glutamate cyclase [Anaeramoeba ignava]|uniref:D-glutamate cyclase n=1 Tax=Anaeramoeba ignava TaxID=1746090 RepID=A0A9Q0RD93_ANAIG|nr:d-glutamate cyclase [Anaeramoeba ignava]